MELESSTYGEDLMVRRRAFLSDHPDSSTFIVHEFSCIFGWTANVFLGTFFCNQICEGERVAVLFNCSAVFYLEMFDTMKKMPLRILL